MRNSIFQRDSFHAFGSEKANLAKNFWQWRHEKILTKLEVAIDEMPGAVVISTILPFCINTRYFFTKTMMHCVIGHDNLSK